MRTANANVEVFKGTVSELAGKMTGPSGEVLNVQDVQFLTRIGNGTFAKKVGTAPGTGTRGGKRAIIWEITPTARLSLSKAAAIEVPAKSEKSRANVSAQPAAIPSASASQIAKLVADALAAHGINKPKRTRRSKAEMAAVRAAEAKAASKGKRASKEVVAAPVKASKVVKARKAK